MTHTAKHTPGPWVAALGERLNTDVYGTDVQGNRIFIAEFATQADAVLGAAAPVMYEALQAMLDGILYTRGASMSEDRWRTLTTIARQALAQAEGR